MKSFGIAAVALLTIALCSVAYGIHETPQDGEKIPVPGANAAKLYRYITLPKRYSDTWKVWPEKGKMYTGKQPHGSFLTTYLNKEAMGSLKAGDALADGSIIVEESYGPDKKLEALLVAYKIKGYSPETGDWFFAKFSPLNGYVLESGKDASCTKCHRESKIDAFFLAKK
jgi:hypothetical protein